MMTIMKNAYAVEFSENASKKLVKKIREHQIPLDEKFHEKHDELKNKLKKMGLDIF